MSTKGSDIIDESAVWSALHTVVDPCSIATGAPIDLVDMGLVEEVKTNGSTVDLTLRITGPFCFQLLTIREAVERALLCVPGVENVTVDVDHLAEWTPDMVAPAARERLRALRPSLSFGNHVQA